MPSRRSRTSTSDTKEKNHFQTEEMEQLPYCEEQKKNSSFLLRIEAFFPLFRVPQLGLQVEIAL